MIIGYARTSTVEQEASFEAQRAQLKAAGCEKVFKEQVSAVSPEREQLEAARVTSLWSPSSTGSPVACRTFATSGNAWTTRAWA
jgi:hypothetical protein